MARDTVSHCRVVVLLRNADFFFRYFRRDAHKAGYDPLLVTVAEGLSETKHPFVFIARAAFAELLAAPGGPGKAAPLAQRLVRPLRKARSPNAISPAAQPTPPEKLHPLHCMSHSYGVG